MCVCVVDSVCVMYQWRKEFGLCSCMPTFTSIESRRLLLRGVFAVNKIKYLTSVEVLETVKEILLKGYYLERYRLGTLLVIIPDSPVKNN